MHLSEATSLLKNEYFSQQNIAEWADLGCGSGLFTFALAQLLKPGSMVHAVDKDPVRFDSKLQATGIQVRTWQLDFVSDVLPFENLDGILMANSLHYIQDKKLSIKKLSECMKPNGSFLVVEYDTDVPVPRWVPYPVSFRLLKEFFENEGFSSVQKLGEHPSVFGRANLYAAIVTF